MNGYRVEARRATTPLWQASHITLPSISFRCRWTFERRRPFAGIGLLPLGEVEQRLQQLQLPVQLFARRRLGRLELGRIGLGLFHARPQRIEFHLVGEIQVERHHADLRPPPHAFTRVRLVGRHHLARLGRAAVDQPRVRKGLGQHQGTYHTECKQKGHTAHTHLPG